MIYKEITDKYAFAEWLKQSDSYQNKFGLEGSKAVQSYYEELSEGLGENISFDPIAWCCEWTEYEDLAQAWNELGNGSGFIEGEELAIDDNIELWLENSTQIIKVENGHVLVREF